MQNGPMTGFVAAVFALVAAGGAPAQQAGNSWKPDGNVEFVVGAGAGGENDPIARAIQHVLTNGRQVDSMTGLNKPGAAQTIAIGYLAGKKGDANEIGLPSGSFACSELHRPRGLTVRWQTIPRYVSKVWRSSPPIPTPCWYRTDSPLSRSHSGPAR